jgi:hypothetical protein
MTRAIWFFEFKGYLTSLASEVQFGYATQDYAAQPADTGLALGFYAGRLEQPGDFRQVMFSDGKTGGASQVSTGEIALVNASRLLDTLRFFAFDGRDAKLMFGRIGDDGALVAGSLRTVLEFQTERPLRQFNRVTVRHRRPPGRVRAALDAADEVSWQWRCERCQRGTGDADLRRHRYRHYRERDRCWGAGGSGHGRHQPARRQRRDPARVRLAGRRDLAG